VLPKLTLRRSEIRCRGRLARFEVVVDGDASVAQRILTSGIR